MKFRNLLYTIKYICIISFKNLILSIYLINKHLKLKTLVYHFNQFLAIYPFKISFLTQDGSEKNF